jgi:multisubunit Na+/H+ antiporter MnhB subunit
MYPEDYVLGAIVLAFLGLIAGLIVWFFSYNSHVNTINDNFTRHCNTLGGHAIITDKDLCVRNGLIVDHKG